MPVFDQYEVETSSAYSGSFTDQVMFGDMFVNAATLISGYTPLGQPNPKTSRRLIASRVAGKESTYPNINNMWMPSYIIEGYASGSWMSRAQRFQPFFSDESWLDSYMPNLVDIYLLNGGELYGEAINVGIASTATNEFSGSQFGVNALIDTSIASGQMQISLLITEKNTIAPPINSDTLWVYTFPFQSRYKLIKKIFEFSKFLPTSYDVSTDVDGISISPVSKSIEISSIYRYKKNASSLNFYETLYGYMNHPSQPYVVGSVSSPQSPPGLGTIATNDLYNSFFGTGKSNDVYKSIPGLESLYPSGPGYQNLWSIVSVPFWGYIALYTAILPRGYKYGIRSATPEQTKCVYRLGRYGQFRDMLEGRPTIAYSPRTGGIVFPAYIPTYISFKSGTLIYEQSRDYVTATNPSYNPYDSGIYDQYYRSGQPFFDRDNED